MDYFLDYQKRLSDQIGAENATKLVKESLVLITLGGNDFVNNYYLIPYSLRSQQFTLPNYCTYVISEYRLILQVNATLISLFLCLLHRRTNK